MTGPYNKKSLLPWHQFGYHIGQLEGGRFLAYYITRVDFLKIKKFVLMPPDPTATITSQGMNSLPAEIEI